jgi:hypothetical protein
MKLTLSDEALILRGRRIVGDDLGQQYFDYIGSVLRINPNVNVFMLVKDAIRMFGNGKCSGCG